MIPIELKTTEGEGLGVLKFPTNASEVTLSQFIDFQKVFDVYQTWLKENDEANQASFAFRSQELKHRVACVSAFIGQDISKMPVGKAFDNYAIDIYQTEVTVSTLFNAIWGVLNTYKPVVYENDYFFTYKDVRYEIPSVYRDAITKQERFESVSTAQAVEALEAWRVFETVKDADPTGGYQFKTILNIIACFARTKGVEFPDDDESIQRFVNDRITYFKDVDMQTALDVYNFFFDGIKPFKPLKASGSFSNRRKKPQKTNTRAKHGRKLG